MVGLGVAVLMIFVRSCYRCAELSAGFHGKLANQQVTFMILEGAMVVIAVACLTAFHPGVAFAGSWAIAGWSFRAGKPAAGTRGAKSWSMKGIFPPVPWYHRNQDEAAKESIIMTDRSV
jgi:hypothetical protein